MKILFALLLLIGSAQAQLLAMGKPQASVAATITWDTNLATTNCSGTKTNASPCVTASKTQTSGELLLMYCFVELGSPTTVTPSNSKGDTWHQIAAGPIQGTIGGNPYTTNVWWAIAGSSGAGTYTCTPSATGYMDAMAGGWTSSTGWNASPIDTIHFAASSSTTCAVTSDGNVTAAAELAVAICQDFDSGINIAGAPWNTARQRFDGNTVIMQDQLGSLTAGATISYSSTMVGTSSGNEMNAMVVLKPN